MQNRHMHRGKTFPVINLPLILLIVSSQNKISLFSSDIKRVLLVMSECKLLSECFSWTRFKRPQLVHKVVIDNFFLNLPFNMTKRMKKGEWGHKGKRGGNCLVSLVILIRLEDFWSLDKLSGISFSMFCRRNFRPLVVLMTNYKIKNMIKIK